MWELLTEVNTVTVGESVSELEPDWSKSLPSESPERLGRFSELNSSCSEKQQHYAFTYSYYSYTSCPTSVSTNAISLNTNRKDNFIKHNKAAHQSRRYGSWCGLINSGGGCSLLSPVVADPVHWGGSSGQRFWPRHAVVQQLITRLLHKNRWQNRREVFAVRQTNTAASWPSLLRIQRSPPQLFIPAFILDPSSSWGNIRGRKSCFSTMFVAERPKWSADGEPSLPGLKFSALWNYMSGRVPAGLLNIVSQWHNKRQEMEVNAGRNKHASLSLISDIKEKCHRKDFPHNNRIIWATLKSSCLTLNCRGNGSKAKYL